MKGNRTNHPRDRKGRTKPLPVASVIERRPSVEELVSGIAEESTMRSPQAKAATLLQLELCLRERERLALLSLTGTMTAEEGAVVNANHRAFLKLLDALGVSDRKDPDEDVDFGS